MSYTMDQKKRRRQLAVQFPRNGIHHSGGVDHREEPKGARHLVFSEVGTRHVNHSLPVRFNQTVSRLATSRGSHDVGVVVDEVLANACVEQFSITIRTEAASIGHGVSLEVTQDGKNGIRRKVFET